MLEKRLMILIKDGKTDLFRGVARERDETQL